MKKILLFISLTFYVPLLFANPKFDKVITIVFENTNPSAVLKTSFFRKMAESGALFTNFYAQTRPSQPNYLAMISGSHWNHFSNESIDLPHPTIVDLLEAKGRTWASYAEDYPGGCFLGKNEKTYVRKHNPFMSFTTITSNPQRCERIKNLDSFFLDWDQDYLPNFSYVIPGNSSNGHDTGVEYASAWFEKLFSKYLLNPEKMRDVLFIITFDEAGFSLTNKIYTVFVGPSIKPGSRNSDEHSHYSLLKLVEDEWGLGSLNQGDSTAQEIKDIWSSPTLDILQN